jgi:hypothetical protein
MKNKQIVCLHSAISGSTMRGRKRRKRGRDKEDGAPKEEEGGILG